MAYIPLKLPAGVYRTGTDFEGSGRWRDANLMRWTQGSMRPVGGWRSKIDATSETTAAPRAIHSWINASDSAYIAVGTANELYVSTAGGIVSDITPSGFTTGNENAEQNTAFGGGFFGTGLFGVRRPTTGQFQECTTWSLDNWGDYLVGCSTSDGKLYEWTGNTAVDAAQISNSPTSCKGLLVTEERFIFALQAGGEKRKIAWCDREDNTTWTAADTNEAGDFELQTSGEIMCAARMRGRTIIVTNTDAHIATYQGPPYVYGFERVGTACGAVSRKGLVAIDEGAFWMGRESFYMFDGSTARQVDCEVSDYVFGNLNNTQVSKVNAVHNSEHGEIWWFFPSSQSNECDRYVAFDYLENHWEIGEIDRTCGVDQGVFQDPIFVDASGNIYDHEIEGAPHGSYTPFAESGPISIGNGDQIMKVNQLVSDEGTLGDVNVTFKTRFHPNDVERSYGPYTLDGNPTSLRFTGRQVRMRVQATNDNDFRVGVMRINAEAGGRR